MNIIFLDVDGVLNSLPYLNSFSDYTSEHKEICEHNLKMLSQLYHKVDGKIVLSSTWRDLDIPNDKSIYPMYMYLVNSLKKYNMEIIDKTGHLGTRPLEIKTWADEHNCKTFISLDDDYSQKDYDACGIGFNLIKTEFYVHDINRGGLQQEHVDAAVHKFEIMCNV